MRVLPDVNILVRANEKSPGPARRLLLELIRRHVVLTSADILIDLARVLRYPRVQAIYRLSEEQIYEYVQFLKMGCTMVPVNPNWNFPIRDITDTPILRAAVAGEADVICTLDKDFYASEAADFCRRMKIAVLDDVALLQRLTL